MINSNGSASTTGTYATGGYSGGGSINIFSKTIENEENINANGGEKDDYTSHAGGAGGNGTISIMNVDLSDDNYFSNLTSNYGTLSPSFNPNIEEYTLMLDEYDIDFTLDGILSNKKSNVTGLGKYAINSGETKK